MLAIHCLENTQTTFTQTDIEAGHGFGRDGRWRFRLITSPEVREEGIGGAIRLVGLYPGFIRKESCCYTNTVTPRTTMFK